MNISKVKIENSLTKDLTNDDIQLVGDAEIDDKGLVHHHISSANDLYEIGISQIVTQVFKLEFPIKNLKKDTAEEKEINHVIVKINFKNVKINKPTTITYNSGKDEVLYPNDALLKDKTYKSDLKVDVLIETIAILNSGNKITRDAIVKNFKLCKIPIMVGSKWCNTYNLSHSALTELKEDPSDPGGYFIIKGVEWVIDCVENILFNKIRIFKNEGYGKEIMRAEFISKPGDFYLNSEQFIIRWLNDGQLTIEIKREKLKDVFIPFYLIYRIMGWNTDKQIIDNILFNQNDPVSKNMNNFLIESFKVKYTHLSESKFTYNQVDCLQNLAEKIKDKSFAYLDVDNNPENYQKIIQFILVHLDIHFLQHIGTDMESRDKKLRFLSLMIRKLFLVKLGILKPTDRDSYNSKRIHAAGTSYAKSFKTYFNASIIQQIKRRLLKDFKSQSFFQINLSASIKASVYGADFEKSITQAITAGNKSQITVSKKVRVNRLSSQLLNTKNQLSKISTLRQVSATSTESAKQSERASEMRRIHLSYLGYIGMAHTPEGEKTGLNKQQAIYAHISKASISAVIKNMLLNDDDIYPLEDIDYKDISEQNLSNVFVNGDWIGCCKDALYIAKKYRQKRRNFDISPELSIVWDNTQDEVYFWADVGRELRPLLIVYNNYRDPEMFPKSQQKKGKFIQDISLDKKHVKLLEAKQMTSEDLLKAGIIEYISAEEQENTYISYCYENLKKYKHDELKEYTHCDIPIAQLGITALTSPFADHNQTPRLQYQTSQCKQTCGMPSKNWPFRADKDTFLQYNCEQPVVKTISSKYVYPNGTNCIVAIDIYGGFNQEDSLIVNKGAIDRGLFNGCKFTFKKTSLEQREEFANPDITNTMNIKSACYDKLENGIIKIGTEINKGDVIIGKVMKISRSQDEDYQFIDHSIIYKDDEPAVVHNVIVDRNEDDERFCKVILRKIRPVCVGDKFSQKPNVEVMTNKGWVKMKDLRLHHKVATMTHMGTLDYVHPSGISTYSYDGDFYYVKNLDIYIEATRNHKMYVREVSQPDFELMRTPDIYGKKVRFCKWVKNNYPETKYYTFKNSNSKILMNCWIKLIGLFLLNGKVVGETIILELGDNKNIIFYAKLLEELNIKFSKDIKLILLTKNKYPNIYYELSHIDYNNVPDFIWKLSKKQSTILLQTLITKKKLYNKLKHNQLIYVSNISLANIITRLAFHCEISASIKKVSSIETFECDDFIIKLSNDDNEPIKHNYEEKYTWYSGHVYCLEIPDTHKHIYYMRENPYSPPCWTGNSNRSGQKGVAGLLMREEDMPFTETGVKPSLIFNPHGIPSRMTIGQLFENLAGNWCAEKGTTTDATIFRKIDIESMATELEDLGLDRYGYHRLYSGITGEFIDALIFMGPIYYQRLQKFTVDKKYAISSGPSDAITNQPLDGKSSNGGLRIGEMERDVLCSHGVSRFLSEKFFDHSDGYTDYICRCGKPATIIFKKNIYGCSYCGDNADITAIPTSWSSKLFIQELETMNVGVRRRPDKFIFDKQDATIFKKLESILKN